MNKINEMPKGVAKIFADIDAYVKKRSCSLSDLFSAVDQGGDGTCDLTELRLGLDRIGIRVSNADFSTLSTMFDPDGSGEIDFSEFVDAIKLGHAVNKKKVDVVDVVVDDVQSQKHRERESENVELQPAGMKC